ncbi:hypothetical protein AP053_gp149 [Ostreococcus mediterraneus virus 1]|uniref:hypothetical protein n=1 Tax=Ostreococcus mediterraneus virus 1 TaxID=1663210 RepID=UPI0006D18170|nr:hypothetical protein AP053_gp149 [Ostreococcus mediterraneus virus 1]ALI95260.1 hypothetical protein OmV1_149 [Ostreococcus mediterraneus virus 1]
MYSIIKMSKAPIIIGLVVLLVVIGVVVYFMMGGEEAPAPALAPTPAPAPTGPPKGRHVKLVHTVAYDESAEGNVDDKNKIINLAELEVFDASGTNLAAGKTVTGSSEYPAPHLWSNLTDGNKTNFAHTLGRTPSEYDSMQVDLGAEKEIKKIVITNRTSCCKNRAVGVKAVILAADGTTVVKETPAISTVADTYTLTFPGNTWS